jgi:hypothetical protein
MAVILSLIKYLSEQPDIYLTETHCWGRALPYLKKRDKF